GALGTLAEIALAGGDHAEAAALFERGLTLRRTLGDKRLVANSLLGLGRVSLLAGDHTQATQTLEQGLALAEEVKDTWSRSVALTNLGRVRLHAGQAAAARDVLLEGLRLARRRNDRRVAAECVQALGAVCAAEGRPLDAVRLFGAAEQLLDATGAVPSPAERAVEERFLEPLRASVEPGAFEDAWAAGRAFDPDELYAFAQASTSSS